MIMIIISYVIIMIIMGPDNAMTGGGQNKSCQPQLPSVSLQSVSRQMVTCRSGENIGES